MYEGRWSRCSFRNCCPLLYPHGAACDGTQGSWRWRGDAVVGSVWEVEGVRAKREGGRLRATRERRPRRGVAFKRR